MRKTLIFIAIIAISSSVVLTMACQKKPKEQTKMMEAAPPAAEKPGAVQDAKKAVEATAEEAVAKGKEMAAETGKMAMEKGKIAGESAMTGAAMGMKTASLDAGKALFDKNCSACHPDGGNIINPKKTLSLKDREANGVKTKEDILSKVRNPDPGMTALTKEQLSDEDVFKIADYIFRTFK